MYVRRGTTTSTAACGLRVMKYLACAGTTGQQLAWLSRPADHLRLRGDHGALVTGASIGDATVGAATAAGPTTKLPGCTSARTSSPRWRRPPQRRRRPSK